MRSFFTYFLISGSIIILAAPTSKSSELTKEQQILKVINTFDLNISKKDAKTIAHALVKVRNNPSCKINWEVLLSVALNESKLDKHSYNKKTKDYGIMQINHKTISRLKFNKTRLLKDIHYNIYAGCYVLTANKEMYAKTRPYWIGIYNAGTRFSEPKVISTAQAYDKRIKKTIKKIRTRSSRLYSL